jgi:hypothetical protein
LGGGFHPFAAQLLRMIDIGEKSNQAIRNRSNLGKVLAFAVYSQAHIVPPAVSIKSRDGDPKRRRLERNEPKASTTDSVSKYPVPASRSSRSPCGIQRQPMHRQPGHSPLELLPESDVVLVAIGKVLAVDSVGRKREDVGRGPLFCAIAGVDTLFVARSLGECAQERYRAIGRTIVGGDHAPVGIGLSGDRGPVAARKTLRPCACTSKLPPAPG